MSLELETPAHENLCRHVSAPSQLPTLVVKRSRGLAIDAFNQAADAAFHLAERRPGRRSLASLRFLEDRDTVLKELRRAICADSNEERVLDQVIAVSFREGVVAAQQSARHFSLTLGPITPTHAVLKFIDITPTETRNHFDPLTKVFSGEMGFKLFQRLIDCRQPFAFILVDVDDMKGLNAAHGHENGSKVLVQVASILSGNFEATDLVARLHKNGDEFGIGLIFKENLSLEERNRIVYERFYGRPGQLYVGIRDICTKSPVIPERPTASGPVSFNVTAGWAMYDPAIPELASQTPDSLYHAASVEMLSRKGTPSKAPRGNESVPIKDRTREINRMGGKGTNRLKRAG